MPHPMQERVKLHILDQVGAQVACRNMPSAELARDYSRRYGANGTAHLTGTRFTVDAEYAAFANATAGSSFEIDDYGGNGAYSHPGCTVVPSAFALAEQEDASGEAVLRAAAVGFEAIIRLALATMPSLFLERGFHHTSVLGALGVAMTANALLREDAETGCHAISIAASHAAGTTEFAQTGGEVKRVHAGIGASGGIRAHRLARMGLTGPVSIIEGSRGFLSAHCNHYDVSPLIDALGSRWQFVDHGSIKPYAACGLFHHHFAALDEILMNHQIAPEEVAKIVLGCEPLMMVHNKAHGPHPSTIIGAQFSAQFSMAMRMVMGANDVAAYLKMEGQGFGDPRVNALAARVELMEDLGCLDPVPSGRVTLHLTDGRIIAGSGYALGSPHNPLTPSDIEQKYMSLVAPEIGETSARLSMDMVQNLDAMRSVSELFEILGAAH
jgi:2-methylcitrate dehydratase PrpD